MTGIKHTRLMKCKGQKLTKATYYMKARTEYYEDGNERLLAYVDVTGEPELVKEISFGVFAGCFLSLPLSVLPFG